MTLLFLVVFVACASPAAESAATEAPSSGSSSPAQSAATEAMEKGEGRKAGEVTIHVNQKDAGPEVIAVTQCDGDTSATVPDTHGGGSPSGRSCGQEAGINFNLTPLVSEGHSFKMQMAGIDRRLVDCGSAIGNYKETEDIGFAERIYRRTKGQVESEVSSFPELGIAGPDSLRLIEDGTLDSAQIYSG